MQMLKKGSYFSFVCGGAGAVKRATLRQAFFLLKKERTFGKKKLKFLKTLEET